MKLSRTIQLVETDDDMLTTYRHWLETALDGVSVEATDIRPSGPLDETGDVVVCNRRLLTAHHVDLLEDGRDTGVVVVSGKPPDGEDLADDADAYLTTPVERAALVDAVEDALPD